MAVSTAGAFADRQVIAVAGGFRRSVAVFGTPWAPKVFVQPVGRLVLAGTTVGYAIQAGGYPAPSVRWQVRSTPDGSFTDIQDNPSAMTADLTLPAVGSGQDHEAYRAVITNSEGSITTPPASLSVVASAADIVEDIGQTGVCRLMAFAFGLDPASPDRSLLPVAAVVDGRSQLVFARLKSHPDVSYAVETSRDLLNWEATADSRFETLTLDVADEGLEQVVLRETEPGAAGDHRWFRVRITHLPDHP